MDTIKKQKKNTKQEFDERVQVAVKGFAEQVSKFVNRKLVSNFIQHAFAAKCWKTFNLCQARENMYLVSSAGKRASGVKRGKTFIKFRARENMHQVSSAGKRISGVTRGKHTSGVIRVRQ